MTKKITFLWNANSAQSKYFIFLNKNAKRAMITNKYEIENYSFASNIQ